MKHLLLCFFKATVTAQSSLPTQVYYCLHLFPNQFLIRFILFFGIPRTKNGGATAALAKLLKYGSITLSTESITYKSASGTNKLNNPGAYNDDE